ncbi:MAG: hypothetical protein IPK26_13255 [Planctomycetes bacterium]|nr:hypothetical protein [Planctomycetota bacterium]
MRSQHWIGAALLASCCQPEPTPGPVVTTGAPTAAAASEATPRPPAPDFESHVAALRPRLPSAAFAIVVEPPFVVIGDGGERDVRRWAERTVRWAVRLLRQDFFPDDPDRILDIWLFANRGSYEKHVRELFGQAPTTPFGWYSAHHGALIMNISTGGGTLVHEIVHPYVAANVSDCPSWLNEGLGSLFEQCDEHDGHIHGLVNWRLDGLQQAIADGTIPPLSELVATTSDEFYGPRSGLHYAMARYLLLWLQEQGRLRTFWADMAGTRAADPTGAAALRRALAVDDVDRWQPDWQRWVMTLRHE